MISSELHDFFDAGGKDATNWVSRPAYVPPYVPDLKARFAHVAVPPTLHVLPGREDQLREVDDVDKAEFVATLIGARDKKRELKPPWQEPPRNPRMSALPHPDSLCKAQRPATYVSSR